MIGFIGPSTLDDRLDLPFIGRAASLNNPLSIHWIIKYPPAHRERGCTDLIILKVNVSGLVCTG